MLRAGSSNGGGVCLMDCQLEQRDDGRWECKVCGWTYRKQIRHTCKSRGLGDTVAKITSAVGIRPCGGCKKRQKKLNELFPYKAQ